MVQVASDIEQRGVSARHERHFRQTQRQTEAVATGNSRHGDAGCDGVADRRRYQVQMLDDTAEQHILLACTDQRLFMLHTDPNMHAAGGKAGAHTKCMTASAAELSCDSVYS